MAYPASGTSLHGYKKMEHATEKRPWGSFTILDEGPGYKVKRIEVRAGHRLSLQSHVAREEHWTFVKGRGVFSLSLSTDEKLTQTQVNVGHQVWIPIRAKHRIEALEDLTFIEVQTGTCDESDITRFDDDYGRTKK